MAHQKRGRAPRRPRARNLCRHFEGTVLVGCAQAGLEVLAAADRSVVVGGSSVACGVALDRCRQPSEPYAPRWDYVFTKRDTDEAWGIEVHHADADEIEVMIAKRAWAA